MYLSFLDDSKNMNQKYKYRCKILGIKQYSENAWQQYISNKKTIRKEKYRFHHRQWSKHNAKRRYGKKHCFIWEYKKSHPCRCGQNHPAALQFHHRDPKTKIAEISHVKSKWSISRIKIEIAKCDVLCSNCHAIHHWEEKQKLRDSLTSLDFPRDTLAESGT